MRKLVLICVVAVAALGLLPIGIGAANAAGALAVGACAAYGYAYDYPSSETAQAAAIGKCGGSCKKSRHHRQGLRCVGGRWPQALRAERLRQRALPWRRAEHRVEALLQTPSLDRHQPFLPSQIQAPITQSLPPSSRLISQYFQAAAQESGPPLAAGMLMP
jgi:hypothetical protein